MALTLQEKKAMKEYIDYIALQDLYSLKSSNFTGAVTGLYFGTLLSTLGGNLQSQTSQLLYPEDFFTRYADAYPIMPPEARFYQTTRSFYNRYGDIDEASLQEYVISVFWDFWSERLTFAFKKTKTLYQPLFENYAKIFSDFAAAEESVTEDYTRTDYPAPYGTVETAYSTGATNNKGTTKRVGKGSENPDRLIKIKEFANITNQYLNEFDWLFAWGGGV